MPRYRVDWAPGGYGTMLAVWDTTTGLLVSVAATIERKQLEELVGLANDGYSVLVGTVERASGEAG